MPPDIRAGDSLDADVENGRIVLTPRTKRKRHVKFVTDPITASATVNQQRSGRNSGEFS
jgi:hypothetical protein